ncbi:hypothetical protein [Streptomyces longispororuber]|uniref:hypothetical protein n=1 Tax=Streptomyces longispororuber TaxID=68230 RepID=UPI0021089C16|nr:hypothetical protein [Streptomyces longispororuber]MCQ4211425.1 hypothetical protein [Streptomyces longispororuber]
MTVSRCVDSPSGPWAHGAREWQVVVITVTITVVLLACAGVDPAWPAAAAALVGALTGAGRRG